MLLFVLATRYSLLASPVNVVTLIDGKEIVGEVLNDEFRIQTPYAALTLRRADVSSLLLDPTGQGMEGAALRNDDRISGFVLTPVIDFRERKGGVLHLRKEKVKNIALALPSAVPAPGMHVLRFRNGDVLTGRLKDRRIVLLGAYGSEEVRSADIVRLEVWGDVETRVRLTLTSGKQLEGRLRDEDLGIELEVGGQLAVYIGNLEGLVATDLPASPRERQAARRTSTQGMVFVEGGEFTVASDEGEADERPARRVFVAPFYIDRTEVTNEQYHRFVQESGHRAPRHWKNGAFAPGTARLPVVYVSYEDAAAYARWIGKRLPSEEEWEKAARGTDGRRYPWGDEFDTARANSSERGTGAPLPVGKLTGGESPCGAADLAGNVWEWTDSWYQFRKSKVFKGGSFRDPGAKLRSSYRSSFAPALEADDLGFRCALSARGRASEEPAGVGR